jgi:hypothetical protein
MLVLIFSGLAMAASIQCSSPTDTGSGGSRSLYPLSLGSSWKYEVVRVMESTDCNAPYLQDTVITDTITVTSVDTVRIGGTGELAAVLAYDPYRPEFNLNFYDSLYVVGPTHLIPGAADTISIHKRIDGSWLWRQLLLTDQDPPPSVPVCGIAAPLGDSIPSGMPPLPGGCYTVYYVCPGLHGGTATVDCLRRGVGLAYHYYVFTDAIGYCSYTFEMTWKLIDYSISVS